MAKLLLYSCLGLLTLQIGVAVLSALYFILAFLTIICNFVEVHIEQDTPPVNYILVGVFVILLLLAALLMFITAYKESKKICAISVGLMVIIFVIFMVTSIISFINQPSLTQYVCMYDDHCPESLWLAGFRYRIMPYEQVDNNTDIFNTTTTSTTTNPKKRGFYIEKDLGRGDIEDLYFRENFDHPKRHETPKVKNRDSSGNNEDSNLNVSFSIKNSSVKNKNRDINILFPVKNSSVTNEDREINISFPIKNSSVNGEDIDEFQIMTDYIKIVKRSLSSMGRHSREGLDEPMELIFQRRNSRVVNDGTSTEAPIIEIDEDESNGGYIIGPDLIMAIILFLIICAFFIFTILVLWSYKKQLKYVQLYAFHPESQPQVT